MKGKRDKKSGAEEVLEIFHFAFGITRQVIWKVSPETKRRMLIK